jgi:hypothetical protein
MPTISPDDDALDRRVRAIVEAVDACRRALIDLTIEDKLLAVERLRGWVRVGRGDSASTAMRERAYDGPKVLWPVSHGSAALERRLRRSMTDLTPVPPVLPRPSAGPMLADVARAGLGDLSGRHLWRQPHAHLRPASTSTSLRMTSL